MFKMLSQILRDSLPSCNSRCQVLTYDLFCIQTQPASANVCPRHDRIGSKDNARTCCLLAGPGRQRNCYHFWAPVLDPKGPWGLAVVEGNDESEVHTLGANDPAMKSGVGFKLEIYPMLRAVLRKSVSS